MNKEEGFKLIFVLILAVYLTSFVSAVDIPNGQCAVVPRADCDSGLMNYIVMGLSGLTNAHVETASGSYPYVVCCARGRGDLTCTPTNSNKIVKISSSTNAHASAPSDTNFLNSVCYSDFSCDNYTSSCPATGRNITLLSLSSPTNAHGGNFSAYSTKICCSSSAPARCDLLSAQWLLSSVDGGVTAKLRVVGTTGCAGIAVQFKVYEIDPTSTTLAAHQPINVSFISTPSGANATGEWTAEWVDDGLLGGNPEYGFNATIIGFPKIHIATTKDLTVTKNEEYCDNKIVCSDYTTQIECEGDDNDCRIAGQSGPAEVDCDADNIECQCTWDSTTKKCGFAWQEIVCNGPGTTGCAYGCTLCHNASGNYCNLGNTCPTGNQPINDGDGNCEWGEGCLSADCLGGGWRDTCEEGTYCSNGKCYSDVFPGGYCQIAQTITKECDEEPVGVRYITWTGTWIGSPATRTGARYEACIAGGQSEPACPAEAQLPFFGNLALIMTLAAITLVYVSMNLKSKKKIK